MQMRLGVFASSIAGRSINVQWQAGIDPNFFSRSKMKSRASLSQTAPNPLSAAAATRRRKNEERRRENRQDCFPNPDMAKEELRQERRIE